MSEFESPVFSGFSWFFTLVFIFLFAKFAVDWAHALLWPWWFTTILCFLLFLSLMWLVLQIRSRVPLFV